MSIHIQTDLAQAAFLMVRGFRFVGVRPTTEPSRYAFLFDDPDNTAAGVLLDYANNGSVTARAFTDALTVLRTQLFAELRRTDVVGNQQRK